MDKAVMNRKRILSMFHRDIIFFGFFDTSMWEIQKMIYKHGSKDLSFMKKRGADFPYLDHI